MDKALGDGPPEIIGRPSSSKKLNVEKGGSLAEWSQGLRFEADQNGKEILLSAEGQQIMMEWERPYMVACVNALDIDGTCDVLEVGFGCGYSADRIQGFRPRSHTIIECAAPVLTKLHKWAEGKPSVRVVEGTWQAMIQTLGAFDCVFFGKKHNALRHTRHFAPRC
jgi:hypothetical protein